MPLLTPADAAFARTVSELVHCNPFTARRIELEREALGTEFVEKDSEWNLQPEGRHDHPNLVALERRLDETAERVRQRLVKGQACDRGRADPLRGPGADGALSPLAPGARRNGRPRRGGRARRPSRDALPRARAGGGARLRGSRRAVAGGGAALLRLRVPAAPRRAPHLRRDHRRVASGGAAARGGLAVGLHPRHAALPAAALRPHERHLDPRDGSLGDRQGAGGARDRPLALHPLRRAEGRLRPRLRGLVHPPQPLRPEPDAHRGGALRPPARGVHRRRGRPRGLPRGVPAARHACSSTRSATSTPRSRSSSCA